MLLPDVNVLVHSHREDTPEHAALAIEHGCELVTADGDFARFPGLRWRHPLRQ